MLAHILPLHFYESGHVVYQYKGKEVRKIFDLMHTPDLLACADKIILIEFVCRIQVQNGIYYLILVIRKTSFSCIKTH